MRLAARFHKLPIPNPPTNHPTNAASPRFHTPGSEPSVPSTVEAQQNAKNTSDLLRRFRELGERMRQVGGRGCGSQQGVAG